MRYKATFAIGFTAGYVLGAKAGRARYEQIRTQFNALMGKSEVQHAAEAVKHETSDLLGTAKRVVTNTFAGKDVTDKVRATPDLSVRV